MSWKIHKVKRFPTFNEWVEKWKREGYSQTEIDNNGFIVTRYDSWGNFIDNFYETDHFEDAMCCLDCNPTLHLDIKPVSDSRIYRSAVSRAAQEMGLI